MFSGGLSRENIPQFVLLTFDDAVNSLNQQFYKDLFSDNRRNPNQCPIKSTFYVSHEWTDYSQVQDLYADGHEIASHTVTHSDGKGFDEVKWADEVSSLPVHFWFTSGSLPVHFRFIYCGKIF